MCNSFFLGLNIFFIIFVECVYLFFGLTKCVIGLSFENPLSQFLLHFIIFFLEFFEFLILKIRFFDDEGLAFVELFDIERFLFGHRNVGEFLNFLFINFELVQELIFSDIFRQTFDKNGEIGSRGALLLYFHLFNFFVVLENGKCDKPNYNHSDTDPALNVVKFVVLRAGVELFGTERNSEVINVCATGCNTGAC
jgi:hypothetical protein